MCKKLLMLTSFMLMLGLVGTASAQLPEGWQNQDVGSPAPGSASEADGVWTITGNGDDIWGSADNFHYVYQVLGGDGVITARVTDNGTGSNTWAKGGVMVRQNLEAGSVNVMGAITGGDGDGGTFQWREEADGGSGSSRTLTGIAPPYWVRLTRVGNDLTCEMSADGVTWELEGNNPHTVQMTDPVYVGLAVTSHADGELRTFTFDNVESTFEIFKKAYGPDPANGAVDVEDAPVLTWIAPDDTWKHELYLGTDADLVAAGDASVFQGQLTEARFEVDVNEPLSRGITYYWKVDVSTGTARASEFHPGNVWSFRVADKNTESWAETVAKDSPGYLDTYVEDGVYDIGALSGDITYEFVVISNPDETEPSMCLIGRRNYGDPRVGLKYEQWNNTGTYGATIFGVVDLDFGIPNSPGEYTHLVFVSSEDAGTCALYVNGVYQASVDRAITLSGLVGIGYLAEAEDGSAFADDFDGTIFGVAIYDAALTDEQIAAHSESYFNPFEEIEPINPGTEGLVAHYAFENDVSDSSANALHGTIVGDPVFAEGPAGYGMALDFDGDGDYVDCSNNELFSITDAFTLSVWINWRTPTVDWQTIIAKGDNAWRLARNGGGQTVDFGFTDGGDRGWLSTATASEVPLGEWHHVTATIDTVDGAKIYLDGALEGTNPDTGGITQGDYPVLIGENAQATGRYWDGLIDEVMIYSRVLSEAEVLYVAGKRATPVDPGSESLLAWWACDEGEGAVVGDVSGNGRDGTFVFGDPAWVEGVRGSAVELIGPTLVEVPPLGMELSEATMAGWILPYGPQPDWSSIIMHRGTGLAHGFNVILPGYQLAYHWNDDSNSWSFRGGDNIAEDEWTFAAVTVAPDKATFYVNGEKGSVNELAHAPALWDNNIHLGGDGADNWIARRMIGALDDVAMYDRALSTGEIRYVAGFRAMEDPGTDNLIAAYPFENDMLDGSGNGNDATVNGDPVFVDGMVGMALEFDGDGDFLDCGANPILALTDAVSISAWIKVAVMGADHKVGGNQDNANGGYKMSVYSDKVEFEIRTAANSAVLNRSVAGGTIIEVDTWYHVVGVYSLADGYIRTYVNGELDRELLTTEALGASPGPLMIGCEPFTTGSYNFNGVMDEIRVYDKALSAAEARYVANN